MDYNNQNPYEQNSGTDPYGQNSGTSPYTQGQDPYGQSSTQSQDPYGQSSTQQTTAGQGAYSQGQGTQDSGQNPYYQQSSYQQNSYQQSSYQQSPYQQSSYQQNAYGQNSYQQSQPQGYQYDGNLEEPMSVKDWLIVDLLMMIPCVNIILVFVWAFSSTEKKSKSNYFKANLIFAGCILVFYLLLVILGIGAGMASYFSYY